MHLDGPRGEAAERTQNFPKAAQKGIPIGALDHLKLVESIRDLAQHMVKVIGITGRARHLGRALTRAARRGAQRFLLFLDFLPALRPSWLRRHH
ncbi:hypothetical protein LBMAG42_49330 [Deltaproteobacteria bacterium]|nr:hypothetical protein LBMAG42_49330 [Deltaproteobacteria bacterium]